MNKPVAWIGKNELQFGFTDTRVTNEKESWDDIPLYTHPVKEQEMLDEITKLRWEVNHREQDIDTLRTTLFDIRCKYDTKTKQRMYSQVYVDELQAEIEALKAHPVKELTDEEILEIAKESYVWNVGKQEWSEIEFAQAILRKAQEK